jgi:hypothetical protein
MRKSPLVVPVPVSRIREIAMRLARKQTMLYDETEKPPIPSEEETPMIVDQFDKELNWHAAVRECSIPIAFQWGGNAKYPIPSSVRTKILIMNLQGGMRVSYQNTDYIVVRILWDAPAGTESREPKLGRPLSGTDFQNLKVSVVEARYIDLNS